MQLTQVSRCPPCGAGAGAARSRAACIAAQPRLMPAGGHRPSAAQRAPAAPLLLPAPFSCCTVSQRVQTRALAVEELDQLSPTPAGAAPPQQQQQQQQQPEQVVVQDDLDQLLDILPAELGALLISHPKRPQLIEVVLDLGRRPEARFQGHPTEFLTDTLVTREDLDAAAAAVGPFGSDNRAGIQGTLHRISALRSRKGAVVGLTCRVGRAVSGHANMVQDILQANLSVLFLGRPGVGKTTAIREIARTLSDSLHKRVVIVDTSNEIGGDSDVPHSAIGGARRMQVADASRQHDVMIEAVENHMPEVLIVDEIGTEAEALACRTIAERGVVLIGTAHGCFLENLIKNPTLSDLVGGVASVTLGDEEARNRGTQKSVLERRAPPTFPIVVEMRDRAAWVAHDTAESVDTLLVNKIPKVQLRLREGAGAEDVNCLEVAYDQVEDQILAQMAALGSSGGDGGGAGSDASALAAAAASLASAASSASVDAQNTSSIDELVASLLGGQRSPAGGSEDGDADGGGGADGAWLHGGLAALERLRGLPEAEALQELQVLQFINSQAGLLRPRAAGGAFGFNQSRASGSPVSAGGAGGKKKKRATKANAKRG